MYMYMCNFCMYYPEIAAPPKPYLNECFSILFLLQSDLNLEPPAQVADKQEYLFVVEKPTSLCGAEDSSGCIRTEVSSFEQSSFWTLV